MTRKLITASIFFLIWCGCGGGKYKTEVRINDKGEKEYPIYLSISDLNDLYYTVKASNYDYSKVDKLYSKIFNQANKFLKDSLNK